ncbi:MAG TPA: SRPBCC domain-containing protein [Usitatibacter sp.]|nr:SRPBCC domain-containing protein [Usitatibacter sp.]
MNDHIIVRDLSHPPEAVWKALVDPKRLHEWAPFDADQGLDTEGTLNLIPVGAPPERLRETQVIRAEEPRLLEYSSAGAHMRWKLDLLDNGGTQLTLVSTGEDHWDISLDALAAYLDGHPYARQDVLRMSTK